MDQASRVETEAPGANGGLVKSLGLLDSTTIVMGSMIGSGVFIVAGESDARCNPQACSC